MTRIAYFRVSTGDQSIEAQRHALGGDFAKEFVDHGVSGTVLAEKRAGFAALLEYVREGDEVHVYAVDRLGRDALDVQATVRKLLEKGVAVHVKGLGQIGRGVGELILAVLAQIAELERHRMIARAQDGRVRARASLEETGMTHRGKTSLGRPKKYDEAEVIAYRKTSSISKTAAHFGLSQATVKRYCGLYAQKASAAQEVAA